MDTSEHRVHLETLKLATAVAWADREVSPSEVDRIVDLARQAGASVEETACLTSLLADAGSMPGADLDLLRRTDRAEVMRIVDLVIDADGRVEPGERDARAAIERLLSERP